MAEEPRPREGVASRRRLGAKVYIELEALAAALALIARRPVKIALTMDEHVLP